MADRSGPGGASGIKRLGTPELIIVIAGAVTFIASFLTWLDFPGGLGDSNAWDEGFFPTYTWIGIFGALMAIQIALANFANVNMPRQLLGFTWTQVHLILAFVAALLAISFLIVDVASADRGVGFWLSLLASIALVVGAVMLHNEKRAATTL